MSDECLICKRYKPSIPRPAVGNLLDPEKAKFNEIVTADLKHRDGELILYLIDAFSRFTRATFLPNKLPTTITDAVITLWTCLFGSPSVLLMDNGGEFANAEVRELGNQLGISIKHTAAYAPWANGLNERNHFTVDRMMDKMIEDRPDLDKKTALQYAVSVRNCWMFVRGFTPCQLAFGHNPRLPSIDNADLPALTNVSSSPVVSEYFNNLQLARNAFIAAENCAKLKKSLQKPVRSYCDVVFATGDQVFYKHPNNKRWQGPATVIGQDGKVVLLRHGSVLRRVHPCRLQHVNTAPIAEVRDSGGIAAGSSSDLSETPADPDVQVVDDSDWLSVSRSSVADNTVDADGDDNTEATAAADESGEEVVCKSIVSGQSLPAKGDLVSYQDGDAWKEVKVLGRGGRKGGQYENWLNVTDGQTDYSVDWDTVHEWKKVDVVGQEVSDTFLVSDISELEFDEAKMEELRKWKLFDVYEEVELDKQKFLCGRWVCSRKYARNSYVDKARYVVKGFQEKVDIQTDSPTGSKECLRLILMFVASYGWDLCSLDVKAAFLQGKALERDIFLKPPAEADCHGKLWKLKKCVYGLNDASRMWYFAVLEKLESLGCVRSKFDYGVFFWRYDGKLEGVIEMHVDDLLWSGTQVFVKEVVQPFCSHFEIGTELKKCFQYLGLSISQADNGIRVNQFQYVDEIGGVALQKSSKSCKETPCSAEETRQFRKSVGQLNWVASQTRPDVSFDVCYLSSVMSSPTVADVILLNKCIKKVKCEPVELLFPAIPDIHSAEIILYSDASLANLPSGRSVGGVILFLVDSGGSSGPLLWKLFPEAHSEVYAGCRSLCWY